MGIILILLMILGSEIGLHGAFSNTPGRPCACGCKRRAGWMHDRSVVFCTAPLVVVRRIG
jgi:hypothetical protein